MDHHDQLRRIFAEHGFRARDGRSPLDMTDEEIDAAMRAFIAVMAEWVHKAREALTIAVTRLGEAFAPLARNPAIMVELERREREGRYADAR